MIEARLKGHIHIIRKPHRPVPVPNEIGVQDHLVDLLGRQLDLVLDARAGDVERVEVAAALCDELKGQANFAFGKHLGFLGGSLSLCLGEALLSLVVG